MTYRGIRPPLGIPHVRSIMAEAAHIRRTVLAGIYTAEDEERIGRDQRGHLVQLANECEYLEEIAAFGEGLAAIGIDPVRSGGEYNIGRNPADLPCLV